MALSPKQARLLCDLTQKDVAERLGVHRDTYLKWEKNPDNMPVGKARVFSSIVGVKMDQIFFDSQSTLSG